MASTIRSRREFLRTAAVGAAAVAGVFSGAAVLAGCGLGRKPVEISLAAGVDDVTDAQIERFNRAYAPYHVTRVTLDARKLAEHLSAENAPAVAVLPALKIAWLARQGALRDVAALFQASAKARGEALYGVDSYFTSGAQRWGLALAWSPDYLVWANKKLWQAAGLAMPAAFSGGSAGLALPAGALSLDEWRGLSARLSAVQAGGLPVIGTDFALDFPALLWLAETFDPPARLFNDDGGRLDLRSNPQFVGAARLVMDWKKEGGIPFHRSTDPYQPNAPDCVK